VTQPLTNVSPYQVSDAIRWSGQRSACELSVVSSVASRPRWSCSSIVGTRPAVRRRPPRCAAEPALENLGPLASSARRSATGPRWPQLIGVDDRAHSLDPAVGDIEDHRAGQPALAFEGHRTRLPIDRLLAQVKPPKRLPARRPAIGGRATLARPWIARLMACALPSPSACSTTSWASSASSLRDRPPRRRRRSGSQAAPAARA
jgi:hypothetical protein